MFLPVVRPDIDATQTTPTSPDGREAAIAPRNKKRILLIDDEETIRKLFQMIVSSSLPDCTVDTAANGKEGTELFAQHHHAAIVMDLHMPVMDGQTAFQEINRLARDRNWEAPAVIFCTGFAPPEIVSRIVADNSMHCLISKPVRGEVLVDAIKARIS